MTANDVILVTGASSGVGLSLAHHLAGRYHVLAAARRIDRLREEFGRDPDVSVFENPKPGRGAAVSLSVFELKTASGWA